MTTPGKARFIASHPFCAECGATKQLTIDHVIPRSRGGSNARSNWQVLCRTCNRIKGNKLPLGSKQLDHPLRIRRGEILSDVAILNARRALNR